MNRIVSFICVLFLGAALHAQEYDFKYISSHIFLSAKVNGVSARLAFDTGSSDVYLDSTWLCESKLDFPQRGRVMLRGAGNEPRQSTIIFSGVDIEMGGGRYSPAMVPVMDLRSILGEHADGLFGLGEWKGKVISIDHDNCKLTVYEKLDAALTEGFTRVPIETDPAHPGQILVPIEAGVAPGKVISGKALLDTGSGQGLVFTSKAAQLFQLDKLSDRKPFHYEHGGASGESAGYGFDVENVTLGTVPSSFTKARYSTDKTGTMASEAFVAVVGNELLSQYSIIIDLGTGALYLKERTS